MKLPWLVLAAVIAGLYWTAREPAGGWGDDLETAMARKRAVVLLIAAPDRPQAAPTRAAIDDAWRELRPRAERVALERCVPRLGRASALALFVFSSGGELVARRDGPIDAALALEWLRLAIDAATGARVDRAAALADPELRFVRANLALRLGVLDDAEREFTRLCASQIPGMPARAHERMARLELERGEIARAREHCELAGECGAAQAAGGQLLLTRGLIEFAQRETRAACTTLRAAAESLRAANDDDAGHAELALARAQAAGGEESRAIDTLDGLARAGSSSFLRLSARRLADDLLHPPLSH